MAVKCFSIAYAKGSRRFVAKKIEVAKKYDFLKDVVVSSFYRAVDGNKLSKEGRLSRNDPCLFQLRNDQLEMK